MSAVAFTGNRGVQLMFCEVCSGEYGSLILDLGFHPLCDDLIPIGLAESAPKFQQLISLCPVCLTAHQVKPVEKELLFKPTYHYRAGLTNDVLKGMNSLVADLGKELNQVAGLATVLDVGCNDGSLLGLFKEAYSCKTIGVDPTDAINEAGSKIDFKFHEYFSASTVRKIQSLHTKIDLITFTNVFAHIEDLPSLLNNVKDLIGPETTLVIENHYLGAILEGSQFDTFYHEHPRTYSARSFEYVARALDLVITEMSFPARYGGNIRVTMKKSGVPADLTGQKNKEASFIEEFASLQDSYNNWRSDAKQELAQLSERALIYGKALPGRAVMLINALNIDSEIMPIVFEQPASPKVGHYVPSSKIEILSDSLIHSHLPEVLVVWSWHIIDEIVSYLDLLGYRGEIWVPLPKFRMYRPSL